MQKPSRIFLAFLLFFSCVVVLGLVFPKQGIRITDRFSLRMWSPVSLFASPDHSADKIKKLLANASDITDTLRLTKTLQAGPDNARSLDSIIRLYRDTIRTNICFLEYPSGDSALLFPFFEKLHAASHGRAVHILHYGDSQIEADRISSYLRKRFQNDFGGHGIGLFSLNSVGNFSHFVTGETSSNCVRYGLNGKAVGKSGPLASLARFESSTNGPDTLPKANNYFRLSLTGKMQAREQQFHQMKLLYGPSEKDVPLHIILGNQTAEAWMPAAAELGIFSFTLNEVPRDIDIRFLRQPVPDIFAVSLEDTSGVMVDNVPLRGAAMVNFGGMDPELFRLADSSLNVGMVILEFGVNVASNVVKSYGYYRDIILREVQQLKSRNPEMVVLMMGISDVAGKNGMGFQTMENIELIRNSQKEAAARSGCVFWDTFKAMGGKNSMPAWVANDPPLAQKDFIHFTPKGADLIGEMFYNALMLEYLTYLEKNHIEKE